MKILLVLVLGLICCTADAKVQMMIYIGVAFRMPEGWTYYNPYKGGQYEVGQPTKPQFIFLDDSITELKSSSINEALRDFGKTNGLTTKPAFELIHSRNRRDVTRATFIDPQNPKKVHIVYGLINKWKEVLIFYPYLYSKQPIRGFDAFGDTPFSSTKTPELDAIVSDNLIVY